MKDSLIKKEYSRKIKLFQKYNREYYNNNTSLISDQEFDLLKNEILDLEKSYSFLKNKNSPSLSIGSIPSKNFKKVKHKVPMLSLGNAFSETDLINFEKKILNFLSLAKSEEIVYSAEPKIDGISASLLYKDGVFVQGLSRGNGVEGEDITNHFKIVSPLSKNINENFTLIGSPSDINYLENEYNLLKINSPDQKFTKRKLDVYEVVFE